MEENFESKKRNIELIEPITNSTQEEGQSSGQQQQEVVVNGDGVDWISNLPEELRNHILSKLQPLEIRRMSILSSKWRHLHNKYPVVEIDELEGAFMSLEEYDEGAALVNVVKCREVFLDSLRLNIKNHDWEFLQKLKVQTAAEGDDEVSSLITQLLTSALKTKADLDLELFYYTKCFCQGKHYVLPGLVFSCGSILVVLFLHGCNLESYNDSINLPCLKDFTLENVFVSDHMLSKLISSLPSIDTLKLTVCLGLKVIRFFNSNLKFLEVIDCKQVTKVEMNVPNLQTFNYQGNDELVHFDFVVITHTLHTLHLSDVKFGTQNFDAVMLGFPQVQTMTLRTCDFISGLKMNCAKLNKFEVVGCYVPDKASITAPNLERFSMVYNDSVILRPATSDIQFRSVKVLLLDGEVELTDDLLQFLIPSLPLLETLHIKICSGFKHLKIVSKSVKFLTVIRCIDVEDGEIEAPKLLHFKYVGYVFDLSHVIVCEQLSVELHLALNFNEEAIIDYASDLMKLKNLISKFDSVRNITFNQLYEDDYLDDRLEIMADDISVSQMIHCQRHLMLKMNFERSVFIHVIPIVLDPLPCREMFTIDMGSSVAIIQVEEQLNSQSNPYDAADDCLKDRVVKIKMNNFYGNTDEMWLLGFLLGRMEKLESISIVFSRDCSNSRRARIQNRIRCFQNSPPNTEILFS